MSIESDRRRVIVAAAVALLLALSLFSPDVVVPNVGSSPSDPDRSPTDVKLVTVYENGSAALWPYTSRGHDYDTLTLPINVVVKANASRVWYVLHYQTDARWNSTRGEWTGIGPEDETVAGNVSGVDWSTARGSTRYTYVYAPPGSERLASGAPGGRSVGWMDETYQLHDGSYFGSRYHIRAYAGGSGRESWTAIQAHREHWDWFRLRHTVGSLADAQKYVEEQFRGAYFTRRISREWYANGGIIDADGWVTVVEFDSVGGYPVSLALLSLAVAAVSRRRRGRRPRRSDDSRGGDSPVGGERSGRQRRSDRSAASPEGGRDALGRAGERLRRLDGDLRAALSERGRADVRRVLLFVAPVAITAVVRLGSIRVERAFPDLSPKLIAGGFYPVLAVGLPVAAYLLARGLTVEESFALASLGLIVGQIAEYSYLGVGVVPINVIVHRTVLAAALGVVAVAGTGRGDDRFDLFDPLLAGAAGWVFALAWPLVGAL